MKTDAIIMVWLMLVLLSLAGTATSLVATGILPGWAVAMAILAISWAKARLILLHYLGLAKAPHWRRGGLAAIAFVFLLFAALYSAGYSATV